MKCRGQRNPFVGSPHDIRPEFRPIALSKAVSCIYCANLWPMAFGVAGPDSGMVPTLNIVACPFPTKVPDPLMNPQWELRAPPSAGFSVYGDGRTGAHLDPMWTITWPLRANVATTGPIR